MTIPYDLIIMGAGPAGLTAGIYAGRAKVKTQILGADPGGNPIRYELIGNYPGFPQGVPGAQLMTSMIMQVNLLGVEMIHQNAEKVTFLERGQKVFSDGEEYASKALIIATGSSPINMEVPGRKGIPGSRDLLLRPL